jgi:prepilin-type N-terminal cleavage/methylation domain-containing protein
MPPSAHDSRAIREQECSGRAPHRPWLYGRSLNTYGRYGARPLRPLGKVAHLCHRAAFTLIEIVVATAVMSLMLVAALNTVAAARTGQYKAEERNRAVLLAQRLVGEILQRPYADPQTGIGAIGPESGESTGNRSLFDDVDDYHNWQATPPQNKDGSAIPWAADYQELVTVAWVTQADLSQAAGSESGVKRITATIKHLGTEVLTLTTYRTSAWVDPTSTP